MREFSQVAGRMTSMFGKTQRPETVSIGWWAGPSSPTPIESWVRMYETGSSARDAMRMAARM